MNKIILFLIFIFASACGNQTQEFNSEKWKESGANTRGVMVEELKESGKVIGKSKKEILNLLGQPDSKYTDNWNYDVITNSRCYIWNCRMAISFDEETEKVKENLAISD